MAIQLEPIGIAAGEDDEERRRREAEMRASMEADDVADEAIAGLGDLDMPEDAPRPTSAEVMGDATPWRDMPNARPTEGGGVVMQGRPARTPPSLASEAEAPRPMARPAVAPPSAPMEAPAVVRDRPAPMPGEPPTLSSAPSAASPSRQPAAPRSPVEALGDPTVGAPKKPPMPERGRLDEGLPSEGDINGARGGDVARRILAALASGLSGGRLGNNPRSEAAELQTRRDAGLQRAQAAKGDAIERDDRLGREESQMELQRTQLTDRSAERQASQAMQERRMALTERQLGAELEGDERTRAQDAQLDQPDSPASQSQRTLLAARLSQLPETQRRAAIEAIGGVDALQTMTGRQAREMLGGNILARAPQMRGGRGGGSGGGNPVRSGRTPTEADRAALIEEAGTLGIPRASAETMSLEDLNREILARGRTDQAASRRAETQRERDAARAGGDELIPGSGISAGGRLGANEAARWRDGYATAQSSMAGLNRVEQVAQQYGRTGAINPEARAALVPELTMLRSMVAQMGGTGVINPSEVPTITAALPDPTNAEQATFETFGRRLQQWRAILSDGVQRRAMTLGVDEAGQRRLVQGLRSGQVGRAPQSAAAAQTFDATINGTVRRFPTEEARQRAQAIAAERGDTFEAANAAR